MKILYGKVEDLEADKIEQALKNIENLRTVEINPVSESVPDYECVQQYLTFRGESLPEVLRRIASYIEQKHSGASTIVIDILCDEDGEWIASFGYNYKHATLDQCEEASKEKK